MEVAFAEAVAISFHITNLVYYVWGLLLLCSITESNKM